MKTHVLRLCIILCIFFLSCEFDGTRSRPPANTHVPATRLIDSLGIVREELSIFVDKSDFRLSLLHGADTLKQYLVVLGSNPVDDKRMEGDMCTPEGQFRIRDLYPHSSWSKFIWIDYPTEDSWLKHRAAKRAGEIPQNATIGGEIGIHGVPEGSMDLIYERENWTFGCISLGTDDINDLYEVCFKGMPVMIRK